MIGLWALGGLVVGVIIGIVLSDKGHEQMFEAINWENNRLWAENCRLRRGASDECD